MRNWTKRAGLPAIGLSQTGLSIVFMTFGFGLVACSIHEERPDRSPPDPVASSELDISEEVEPRTPPSGTSPIATCDIEPIWWSDNASNHGAPSEFRWTPDRLAILAGQKTSHQAWRALDGVAPYDESERAILDSTPSMNKILTQYYRDDVRSNAVQDWATGDILWTRPLDGAFEAMSQDATRVATMSCKPPGATDGTVEILIHDVANKKVLHTERLKDHSCHSSSWSARNMLVFSPDGRHLAVGIGDEHHKPEPTQHPAALLISEADDGFRTTRHDFPVVKKQRPQTQIASLSFDPASERFTVVASSGDAVEIDTSSGSVVRRSTRGAFAANHDLFGPRDPTSPIAWTDTGDVEAIVATDGSVELRTWDGEPFHRVKGPDSSNLAQWNPEVSNPAVAIAFAPGDEMFAVLFHRGIGVWGCPGALDDLLARSTR